MGDHPPAGHRRRHGFFTTASADADYYNKKTTDLLFGVTLPDTSGYGSARQNVGSVRFYGARWNSRR